MLIFLVIVILVFGCHCWHSVPYQSTASGFLIPYVTHLLPLKRAPIAYAVLGVTVNSTSSSSNQTGRRQKTLCALGRRKASMWWQRLEMKMRTEERLAACMRAGRRATKRSAARSGCQQTGFIAQMWRPILCAPQIAVQPKIARSASTKEIWRWKRDTCRLYVLLRRCVPGLPPPPSPTSHVPNANIGA